MYVFMLAFLGIVASVLFIFYTEENPGVQYSFSSSCGGRFGIICVFFSRRKFVMDELYRGGCVHTEC